MNQSRPPGRSPEPNDQDRRPTSNRSELMRYAGLSTEVFASVGISVFLGVKADKWVHPAVPVFSWALPLLVIVVFIVKLVKETSKRKDGK